MNNKLETVIIVMALIYVILLVIETTETLNYAKRCDGIAVVDMLGDRRCLNK